MNKFQTRPPKWEKIGRNKNNWKTISLGIVKSVKLRNYIFKTKEFLLEK